jgi:hypothetical protein
MKKILAGLVFGGVVVTGWTGWAQTHKVTAPESVVRAVGVYEWTGDLTKPKASRLIPVSLFIEGHIEDAGVYIARPVPFALLTGNVYELQDAGTAKGTLELAYARHMQAVDRATGDSVYDDGWFGYGTFHGPVVAKKTSAPLRQIKTTSVITSSATDSNKPHLTNKSGDATTTSSGSDDKTASKTDAGSSASSADSDRPTMKRRGSDSDSSAASTPSAGSTPADDPDRPTMKRRTSDSGSDSGSGSTTQASGSNPAQSGGSTPADDPDRPTMKRRSSDAGDTTASSGATPTTTSGDSDPANDPDRPTLKRRSPEEAKKQRAQTDDIGSVSAVGSLNDDPNRPNLHRGKPTSAMTEEDLPKLSGLPQDLHQMVAVSDAKNRPPHEFARPWEDAAEKAAVLSKMQTMARAQLAAYVGGKTAPASTAAASSSAAKKTVPASRAHRTTTTAPAQVTLLDEDLKGYTLSYGGAPTYVYSAHTAGTGADLRYVTVVAQADALGELKPAMKSVTDAAHLDRAPWMRFVDVVDVEASNRASMLFELRGQNARQFALYRVIADQPEQIFLTGTTQ